MVTVTNVTVTINADNCTDRQRVEEVRIYDQDGCGGWQEACCVPVEGNLAYFHNYVAISKVLKWTDDSQSALDFEGKEGMFVFSGDSQ
eukprot:2715430-Rhodomonas_salina.1